MNQRQSWLIFLVLGLNCARCAHSQVTQPSSAAGQQGSGWAGSESCAVCHNGIFRQQDNSNHAKSLRPAAELSEFRGKPDYQWQDRSLGAMLKLQSGPRLESTKDGEQKALLLEWAFGSGKKGITPVGRHEDGSFVESRLSWYADGGFGITTGAGQREAATLRESLGRTLSHQEAKECFSCHTTGYVPGQALPARSEMGIRCERCHGPGASHVEAMRKGAAKGPREIINPGKMTGPAQVQMCGVCHGKTPDDSDIAALQRIEQSPNTVRFPSQRLVLSRCYNESPEGLSCSQCHNPHSNVSVRVEDNDRACLVCHSKPRRTCPEASSKCSSCHMPKQQVMLHSLFTDHYIRVIRPGGKP